MGEKDKIQLFENKRIRTAWDEEKEAWYFSVVDVVAVLTDAPDYNTGRKYWNKLKQRLSEEGANQLVTDCHQLKMKSPKDGKRYATDMADTEQLLRIIQSIPSPKAEPFKMWLAAVGRERIEETKQNEIPPRKRGDLCCIRKPQKTQNRTPQKTRVEGLAGALWWKSPRAF